MCLPGFGIKPKHAGCHFWFNFDLQPVEALWKRQAQDMRPLHLAEKQAVVCGGGGGGEGEGGALRTRLKHCNLSASFRPFPHLTPLFRIFGLINARQSAMSREAQSCDKTPACALFCNLTNFGALNFRCKQSLSIWQSLNFSVSTVTDVICQYTCQLLFFSSRCKFNFGKTLAIENTKNCKNMERPL